MRWLLFASIMLVAANFGWWVQDLNAGGFLFGALVLIEWWVYKLKGGEG